MRAGFSFPLRGTFRFRALALVLLTAGALGYAIGAVAAPSVVSERHFPYVERISLTERADGKGYVVRFHTDGPVAAYSAPRLLPDGRLEVVLFNTRLASDHVRGAVAGPVVRYAGEEEAGHLFFRFTLVSGESMRASAYRDETSDDILVSLSYADGQNIWQWEALREPRPVPARGISLLATPATELLPAIGGGTTGRMRQREPELLPTEAAPTGGHWLLDTVVIDAGHGGKDPGARAHGILEKDIALSVALKVGEYIEERLGVRVEYTREDDRFIELADRGRIANEHGGKLFISIHANAAGSAAASGTETFFLGLHKSNAARSTMERENEVVKLESSQREYEEMDEEALIRMALTQSAYMQHSQQLAMLIQEQFEQRVHRKNRGVKQAGFYVLWGASMPAVLVELGFLTNKDEAAFLASESGQDYLASAIFRAVRAYKEQYDRGLAP